MIDLRRDHVLVQSDGFLKALFTLVHVWGEQTEHTVVIPQLAHVVRPAHSLLVVAVGEVIVPALLRLKRKVL